MYHYGLSKRRKQYSAKYWTWRTKRHRRSGPTNQEDFQRSQWKEVNIWWSSRKVKATLSSYEKQDLRRNDQSVSSPYQSTTIRRNCTQATSPWQQMFQRFQRSHQDQQHDIPARSTPRPLTEQSRKGDPNVQGPFCGNSLWRRHFFSVKPLGPTITPSRTHPQHVATVKHDSHSISLHVPLGATWLANPFAPLGCKVESHLVPGIREIWAPHTASGYYVGTSWEHYRCHKVYIIDTHHTRMCSSVFFKHKYLTMPSLPPADALIRAADDLTTALAGVIPPPSMTTEAITQLINIFKTKPKKRRMRQHFKGCSGRMHKLKGCSTRPWQNPCIPRQLLQPHIHHSRLKSIPKWMLAHYKEHQLSIQKTTPTHQDRQPTHVTSTRFEQSQIRLD